MADNGASKAVFQSSGRLSIIYTIYQCPEALHLFSVGRENIHTVYEYPCCDVAGAENEQNRGEHTNIESIVLPDRVYDDQQSGGLGEVEPQLISMDFLPPVAVYSALFSECQSRLRTEEGVGQILESVQIKEDTIRDGLENEVHEEGPGI